MEFLGALGALARQSGGYVLAVLLTVGFARAAWLTFAGEYKDKTNPSDVPHPRAVLWPQYKALMEENRQIRQERDTYRTEMTLSAQASADLARTTTQLVGAVERLSERLADLSERFPATTKAPHE